MTGAWLLTNDSKQISDCTGGRNSDAVRYCQSGQCCCFKSNTNMAKFKRGDMVSLISGGMSMTVTGVIVDNTDDMNINVNYQGYSIKFGGPSPAFYSCSWFEKKAKKEDVFPEESLKIVRTDNEQ